MEEGRLDLKDYWRILLRQWWLLFLGAAGTAIAAFFLSGAITPTYESTSRILVQGGQTRLTPFLPESRVSEDLATTYRELIKTRPIMEQVLLELSLPYGPGSLSSKIKVSSKRSFIRIVGRDHDPAVAAKIADATAVIFINDFRNRQFAEIAQLQATLNQRGFVDDPNIIAAQAATLSTLSIIEEAIPALSPSSPRTRLNTIFGGLLGLMAAGVLVFLIEHLNDRIQSPNEIKKLTGMTSLVSINRFRSRDKSGPTILAEENRSGGLAESFKFLAINLGIAAEGGTGIKSLLVTSSVPGEGKTTVAVNLSIALATMGISVILVDSDLRRPNIDRIFDIPQKNGLDKLLDECVTLEQALSPTLIDGLQVITCGATNSDVTANLRTNKMREIVKKLTTKAEVVILDSPPLINVSDTMLLAPVVDGVLFVVDAHGTDKATVQRAAESLEQAQTSVMGAVFNKVSTSNSGYYGYNYRYNYYEQRDRQNGTGRRENFVTFLKGLIKRD